MTTYTNISGVACDGVMESSVQGILLGSMSSLPTADETNVNCVILYTGATTGTLTQNRFYKCTLNGGVYSWVQTEVSSGTDLSNYVTKQTKVNGHALTGDVNVTVSDIGAVPDTRTVNGKRLNANITLNASDVSALADNVTINGYNVSSNPTLDYEDVGALSEDVLSTAVPSSASGDDVVPTSKAVYNYVNPVSVAVGNETSARSSADQRLQGQIDALTAKSDVVDIVGTYQDLQNYSTTGLGDNDVIKVLSDSTHDNAMSYYRWSTSTSAWTFIGTEGPYTTPSQVADAYVPQTRTVNNKALSSNIVLNASDVSAIPSSYLKTATPSSSSTDTEVPTSKAVYTAVNAKQNKLTFDATPTENSTNPVTSGGVYTAINELPFIKAVIEVTTKPEAVVTATATGYPTLTATADSEGIAQLEGAKIGVTYTVTATRGSKTDEITFKVTELFNEVELPIFRFTIVAITQSVADPYSRCTYPSNVTINGKTYKNSAPAEADCAKGTSLGGWVGHWLIEGIQPVARNGTTWVTTGYSLTDSTSWDSTWDWFTEFPFRWMGWYTENGVVYILLSNDEDNPDTEVFVDYHCLNNSNARVPNFHIGCFDGTVSSSRLYSRKTGSSPTVSTSLTDFITYAKARGTDYDIITYYQIMYITALFVTLYKTTDCQGYSNSAYGLGKGYVGGSSVQSIVGLSFDNDYGMYGDRSGTTSRVSFFWIHDIWGNIYQLFGSAKTGSNRRLMTQTGKVSSVSDSDFNLTDLTPSITSYFNGYVSEVAGGRDSGPFPSKVGGSATTYYADASSLSPSSFYHWGGSYGGGDYAGLFYYYYTTATLENAIDGSRLSYKGGRT